MISRHLTGFLRTGSHGRISKGVLQRSSSTIVREIQPPISDNVFTRLLFQRSGRHVILTLDPSKFAEKKQCRLHIGNLLCFRPHVPNHSGFTDIYYTKESTYWHRYYPPNTTAFLYYFRPPGKPRIAGELRLRVASSDDHASFENGYDLLRPNGQPWSRSLYRVSKFDISLYEKLREEGLVSDDLDAVLSTFPHKTVLCQHLYNLNDPFSVDFSNVNFYLIATTEKGMERVRVSQLFIQSRPTPRSPYTGAYTSHRLSIDDSNRSVGRALARFERSTLPDHKGTRTVMLRILKIITPVKCVIPDYGGYIALPKEGELHRRTKKSMPISNPPAWSTNIDKNVLLRGLGLLWDI
jgi:hypothetical protein